MAKGGGSMYGPLLIGACLNCLLYGATAIQTLIYFQTFKGDKWWIKMFVLYLLFCETTNTIFNIGVIYEPLIIRNGTPEAFILAPTMLPANPLTTVMISLPVQLFIAWRVRVMSKSNVLPAVISLFALTSFAGGVATTVTLPLIHYEYSRFRFSQNSCIVVTWLAFSAAADVIIAASLVHSLSRRRTGFTISDDVVNRLIRLTVQTGLITAVSATLDLTLYLVFTGKMWNFVLNLCLSKLYSNTLLSSLNARGGWKAVSSMRDNILFGEATDGNMARSRTQIEIVTTVTTNIHPPLLSGTIPMKAFDAGAVGHCHDDSDSSSAINAVPESVEAS